MDNKITNEKINNVTTEKDDFKRPASMTIKSTFTSEYFELCKKYGDLKKSEDDLYMLLIWASKLVGNKGAFEEACVQWQKSFRLAQIRSGR